MAGLFFGRKKTSPDGGNQSNNPFAGVQNVVPASRSLNERFIRRIPLIASLIYLLIGITWVVASDLAILKLIKRPSDIEAIQIYKGCLYVLLSAGLIYALLAIMSRWLFSHQAEIRRNAERLSMALNATNSGVWEWHLATRSLYVSPHLKMLFGYSSESRPDLDQLRTRVHQDDYQRFGEIVRRALESPEQEHAVQYRFQRQDGSYAWLSVRGRVLFDAHGNPERIVGVATDISHSKELTSHIERLTHFDLLTGLPNRTLFMQRLAEMTDPEVAAGSLVLVARLDLRRFQDINSELGMDVGDIVLSTIAERLEKACGPHSVVSRFAADDFALVTSAIPNLAAAQTIAEAISHAANEPISLDAEVVHVRLMMGATIYPNDGTDPAQLISNAELGLARAKEQGQLVEFYEAGMNESYRERAFMGRELRAAIHNNSLTLVYQPIVQSNDSALVGFEALLRWNHPRLGFVSPMVFVPLAETLGLINELGLWVLRTACGQAAAWNRTSKTPLLIAVNVSAKQMERDYFVNEVAAVLAESGLPPECLELEITESVLMADPEAVSRRLQRLRALNVQVAIDDFGTGYSSLAALRRLPVSKLKIDRTFVQDLGTGGDGGTIVNIILELAHNMGLTVTAEGVETEQQMAFLRERRCQTIQGYLISRPMPPDHFQPLLLKPENVMRQTVNTSH